MSARTAYIVLETISICFAWFIWTYCRQWTNGSLRNKEQTFAGFAREESFKHMKHDRLGMLDGT